MMSPSLASVWWEGFMASSLHLIIITTFLDLVIEKIVPYLTGIWRFQFEKN